jgi:hypothetical protein
MKLRHNSQQQESRGTKTVATKWQSGEREPVWNQVCRTMTKYNNRVRARRVCAHANTVVCNEFGGM